MKLQEKFFDYLKERHEQSLRESKEPDDSSTYCPISHRFAGLILLTALKDNPDEIHFETNKKDFHAYVLKEERKTDDCENNPLPPHIVPAVMGRLKEICGFDLRSNKEQHTKIGQVDAFYTPIPDGERVVLS